MEDVSPVTNSVKVVKRVERDEGHHFILPYGAWDYECEYCFLTLSEPVTYPCPKSPLQNQTTGVGIALTVDNLKKILATQPSVEEPQTARGDQNLTTNT